MRCIKPRVSTRGVGINTQTYRLQTITLLRLLILRKLLLRNVEVDPFPEAAFLPHPLAVALLGEAVTWPMVAAATAILAGVALARGDS